VSITGSPASYFSPFDKLERKIEKKVSNQSMKPTAPFSLQLQRACRDTLDFVSVPGFPSAIRVLALTHSRRIVFQR
jgi:hypothetical protein